MWMISEENASWPSLYHRCMLFTEDKKQIILLILLILQALLDWQRFVTGILGRAILLMTIFNQVPVLEPRACVMLRQNFHEPN